MEYVLGIALVSAVGGLIWACVTAVRLALARRDDAEKIGTLTAERNSALADAAAMEVDRDRANARAQAGQLGTVKATTKEIADVHATPDARSAINLARARRGLPPLPDGLPVAGPAPATADPAPEADALPARP